MKSPVNSPEYAAGRLNIRFIGNAPGRVCQVPLVVLVRRNRLQTLLAFAVLIVALCVDRFAGDLHVSSWRVADAVSGRTVLIDPGHGGPDPGAVGRSGVKESDIVLSIANRLRSLLNRAGVEVIMTRVDDTDLAGGDAGSLPAVRKRRDLLERARIAAAAEPDLTVSIHANSFPEPIWSGAQTFYRDGCSEGRLLALAIQDSLVRDLGPNPRKAKSADLYILNSLDPPVALVEVGFLSNPREEMLLATEEYQQRVAEAIFAGIVSYLVDLDLRCRRRSEQSTPELSPTLPRFAVEHLQASSDLLPIESAQPDNSPIRIGNPAFTYMGTLYFGAPTNFQDNLVSEQRNIIVRRESDGGLVEELALLLLEELIAGPGEKSVLAPVLPKSTKVRSVTVLGDLAVVDLSGTLVGNYWGGSRSEELTIYSMVNTLTRIEEINRVKLSIDGRSDVSIAGHMVLDKEYTFADRMLETEAGADRAADVEDRFHP